jgi:hypothetical protein
VAVKPVSYKTKVGEQRVKTGKLGWKLRPTVNGMQITRTFFGTYEEAVVEISLIIASASKATKVSATRAVTVEKYMGWKWSGQRGGNGMTRLFELSKLLAL